MYQASPPTTVDPVREKVKVSEASGSDTASAVAFVVLDVLKVHAVSEGEFSGMKQNAPSGIFTTGASFKFKTVTLMANDTFSFRSAARTDATIHCKRSKSSGTEVVISWLAFKLTL